MTNPTITEIRFTKIHQKKSLVGFVAFLYDGRLALKDIAVHELREPKNGMKYRLVYPQDAREKIMFHPVDKKTQEHIDAEINSYLINENAIPTKGGNHEPRMDDGVVRQSSR